MQLGIFAKTFARPSVEETLEAAKSYGVSCVQFNFSCAGLPTLPGMVDATLTRRIRSALENNSLSMAAVSGTGNLIHPDSATRASCIRRVQELIGTCQGLGTAILTLCTGTRDPEDMWKAHPLNDSAEAWRDLISSLESLLPIAEQEQVLLGIEPEGGNVISSAEKAKDLLKEMSSPCLKIILDAANLVQPHGLENQRQRLQQAFDLLGTDVVLAHAKDLAPDNTSGHGTPSMVNVAAGKGQLDYSFYIALLNQAGFQGALILHGLTEAETEDSITFLCEKLAVTS